MPIEDNLEDFKVEEWDKEKVLEIFKELNFNRYIERFNLKGNSQNTKEQDIEKKEEFKQKDKSIEEVLEIIKKQKKLTFFLKSEKEDGNNLGNSEKIIKEKIMKQKI